MADSRINLKDTWTAAILGCLIPGAGHLYQGRYFKAVLYAVCIGGLYLCGMQMSHGQIVSSPTFAREPQNRGQVLKFAAQAGVGLPAVVSVVQSKRFHAPANQEVRKLDEPLIATFEGSLTIHAESGETPVSGTIEFKKAEGKFGETLEGRFIGKTETGESVDRTLGGFVQIARPISNDPRREVSADVMEMRDGHPQDIGSLNGSIPRAWGDRVLVPLTTEQDRRLHGKLGKHHELATVFTMIAGLLNILAAWDAFGGPAYGYGDEEEEAPERASEEGASPPPPEPATVASP